MAEKNLYRFPWSEVIPLSTEAVLNNGTNGNGQGQGQNTENPNLDPEEGWQQP
jgi:hypothetical protein